MIADLLDISEDDARGICELAGHDLTMARHFRERAETCDDGELANGFARSYRGAARSYRQTLAMKLRLKQALLQADRAAAAEVRGVAEARRQEAEQERRDACERQHMAVRAHFERVLWDEYEDDDAQELLDAIDTCLLELAEERGFLATPPEALIGRLSKAIGLGRDATTPDDITSHDITADDTIAGEPTANAAGRPPPPAADADAAQTPPAADLPWRSSA